MNENEFESNGVTYVAEIPVRLRGCGGCAFEDVECWVNHSIPFCSPDSRIDGRDVIFVAKP